MFRLNSIRSVLFVTFSGIIALILAISLLLFYWWSSDTLRKQAADSISASSTAVKEKLDLEYQKMDAVSQTILYSNLVKERFLDFSGREAATNEEAQVVLQAAKDLAEILVAMNGPALPVQQINLYDFQGNLFGSGFDNRRMKVDLEDKSWYPEVLDTDIGKIITEPEVDEQLRHVLPTREDVYSVSLLRLFRDRYNSPEGIVEVKQSVTNLFKSVSSSLKDRVIVYDDNGNLIYPPGPASESDQAYVRQFLAHSGGGRMENPDTGAQELFEVAHSSITGWNSAVIRSEQELFEPLRTFTKMFSILCVGILLLAVLLTFLAAKKITEPIARLHRSIKSTDLDNLAAPAPLARTSGINELDRLQIAFGKMGERLHYSMEQLMLAQRQELQAKLVALQSQINPHFLYNTLATIGVMAEEGMNGEIVEMIESLSDLMRYVSSDDASLVELGTELDQTRNFLSCFGFRYGAKLSFGFEIEEAARKVEVPKLIVQPLVENAAKYGTKEEPPWSISVRAYSEGTLWFVEVRDNGPGFDRENLARFREQTEKIDRSGETPSLQVGGMGLLNVYIRLKLLYGNRMTFRMEDAPDGGAIVTIGGTYPSGSGG